MKKITKTIIFLTSFFTLLFSVSGCKSKKNVELNAQRVIRLGDQPN